MPDRYLFLDPASYLPWLDSFGIDEPRYCVAMSEVVDLFPWEKSWADYRETLETRGAIGQFDLVPKPNDRLDYNPLPVLLHCSTTHNWAALLYLGLALNDAKNAIGRTKAFNELTSKEHYRGALFEIEVAAALARSGLQPRYSTNSPDFCFDDLSLGVEASIREVPFSRAVAERLIAKLAFRDFSNLTIEITNVEHQDLDNLLNEITNEVTLLLESGHTETSNARFRVSHERGSEIERVARIKFGRYEYGETLAHLVKSRLEEKEEQIRRATAGKTTAEYVIALDVRSLLTWPFVPESEYERKLADHNNAHFQGQLRFREAIFNTCTEVATTSSLIRGVLLWDRRRTKTLLDETHRRYSINLITAERSVEIDELHLGAELSRLAHSKGR